MNRNEEPGLERFCGKAFGWRLGGYAIAALAVPAIWAARDWHPPYPWAVDTLFVPPRRSTELLPLTEVDLS